MLEDNSYVWNPLRKQSRNIKLNINIWYKYDIFFFHFYFGMVSFCV